MICGFLAFFWCKKQMVKGGKVSSKRRVKPRIRSDYKGSDDSDEDYVISDEEKLVSEDLEDDYCSSLDGNASEESFGSFAEEEEEEEEEEEVRWARKNSRSRAKKGVGRSRAKKGIDRSIVDEEEEDELEEQEQEQEDEEEDDEEMKKLRKYGRSRAKKGKDIFIAYEEEDEQEEEEEEEEEVRKVARSKSQNGFSGRQKNGVKPSQKRRRATYEEMADQDYDDEEDEDDDYDEEFTPDEDDFSELEEESRVKKKKTNVKVGKQRLKKKVPIRRKSKKPLRKKQKKNRTLRRKARSDDDDGDFMDSNLPVREKNKNKRPNKRRRFVAPSDSDFVSSGSSDCDYTISEEEREQVREAMQLCGSLESSILPDKIQENETVQLPRKPPGRKGKEKVEQVKVEVVKQVCGICLSEEDKRRVRGTLDCCTHYFCFSCIMEWGKVESRCPLCKQRFKAITKPTRAGTDLRDVVITVPERDQVYQPTEEELRSYLDPYENVICTECHEGGDDGLMLLCDVCDSPAHTYCVGLGREVPEGNWYCDGCRPVALGSSSSQVQGRLTEQRTTNNILPNRQSPAVSFGEGLEIDLNSVSSPRSYITQGFGNSSSPWFHVGGFQVASPGSGAGAPTLSGRRLMHRHIQQLITANRRSYLASRNERNSSANLSTDVLNGQTAPGRETVVQHTRTDGMDRSFHTFFEERLQENPSLQVQDNDIFLSTSSHQRRQVVQDPTTTSADRPSNGTLWPGLTENTISGRPPHFSSISDGGVPPNTVMGPSDFHRAKEQLQSLVISHVKNLSRDRDLGQSTTTFQEIARSAMHTVLAACELEHTGSEVVPVPPSSPCPHIELMAGKTSLMRGCCSSCFAQFVEDVVKRVMEYKLPPWLRLAL